MAGQGKRFTLIALFLSMQCLAAESIKVIRYDGKNSALEVVQKEKEKYVRLKQFCQVFECAVTYQWSNFRAIIHIPPEKKLSNKAGAIVSSMTQTAIVDGNLIEYDSKVISDAKSGYLLPLDLSQKLAAALDLGTVVLPKAEIVASAKVEKIEVKSEPVKELRDFKVMVIDPGHGGNDFGTRHEKLMEKDIALIYAMKLRDQLKKEMPDLQVYLSREDDRYISLPDRSHFANVKEAGFFLSLHINHAPNLKIEGSETYILNPNATDDDAKRTAMLENDNFLRSMKQKDPAATSVLKILADMEQTKYIQNSALAASYIQQELSTMESSLGLKNRGVKQAMFYVLSQAAMPSVLVEMGFLSNTNDRKRMMDVVFQQQFIEKITAAVKKYRKTK